MLFATYLLRVTALSFITLGLGFAAAPGYLSEELLGEVQTTPGAVLDMRATYGGLGVGVGLALWSLTRQRETIVAGLIVSSLLLTSIALARLAGFVMDGGPTAYMWGALALESLFVVLTLQALKRITD